MEREKDFFDKIMGAPVLRYFQPFYEKNREMLLYIFFGGLTFLVSIFSFAVFHITFAWNELVANIASWIIAVSFAFFTNRIWVFQAPTKTVKAFLIQLAMFFGGRVVTLVVEEVILLVFVTFLQMNSMVVKVAAQVIVIVLNYILSKLVIFKNREQ